MTTIHHATAKRAQKLGITLAIDNDMVVASFEGRELARDLDPRTALVVAMGHVNPMREVKDANGKVIDHVPADRNDDGTKPTKTRKTKKATKTTKQAKTPAATGSVIKADYRDRYSDGSNGDDLAKRLKKFVTADDGTVDLGKLKALAERNGIWNERYATLNPGMARMNVGNRLRAAQRHDTKIVWE